VKILVLGGTGDMGRRAVLDLAQAPDVSVLTIAGRSVKKAETLAQQVGAKARAASVDVNDHARLVALMREHDVVAGAVGPYYRYEVPLAKAAIEAGTPYVSICDDFDAAERVLELDAEARARGVTVITGAGWTPGLTNILVKKAVMELDEAQEAHVSWAASASDSQGVAVLYHMLHILTGDIPTFMEGERRLVPAGSEKRPVDFGPPMGAVRVYHVGHPEPVTLPRFLPQLRTVTLRGGLLEGYLNTLGILIGRSGLTRSETRRDRLVRLLSWSTGLLRRIGALKAPVSGAHVEVRGVKDGRPAAITYSTTGPMADLTALPLAVAALMIGRGQVQRKGVFAPEAEDGIDPDRFLDELAKRGITLRKSVDGVS